MKKGAILQLHMVPGGDLIMFDLLNNTTAFRYMDTQKDLFLSTVNL